IASNSCSILKNLRIKVEMRFQKNDRIRQPHDGCLILHHFTFPSIHHGSFHVKSMQKAARVHGDQEARLFLLSSSLSKYMSLFLHFESVVINPDSLEKPSPIIHLVAYSHSTDK